MSAPAPPLALPAPNECLQPTMGTGDDNELRFRIDGTTPVRPPLRRGIYLDPNRGLWSDPAPESEWGAADDVQGVQEVSAGGTLPIAPLVVDVANTGGPALAGVCLFTVRVQLVSAANSGLVRVSGAVGMGGSPNSGPVLSAVNMSGTNVVAGGALSVALQAPGFAATTLYGRVWVHNTTAKPVTVKAAVRRMTFTGTSRRGDFDG